MSDKFEGFANAPVNKKGEALDFRKVPAYEDTSEAGVLRSESQTTASSIQANKTSDTSTDGSPMANVGTFGTQEKLEGDSTPAEGTEASGSEEK